LQHADVEDVDDHQVAGLRAFDPNRATQVVHLREVHDLDVPRIVVVPDLPAGPVDALDAKLIPGFDPRNHGNVRMPAVVQHLVFFRGFGDIDADQSFHLFFSFEKAR
jgi:hypothetical protein